MRSPKVYIVNDTGQDYTKACAFGELSVVVLGKVNPFQPQTVQQRIAEQLAAFDPEVDYLLPSGSALANGLAFAHVAGWLTTDEKNRVKLLMYDSKTDQYHARSVEL